MTRQEFQEKMTYFENDLCYVNSFNPLHLFFPVLFITNYLKNNKKRELADKVYSELMKEIDQITPPLDSKEYQGWKKRIQSAYSQELI